VIHIMFLRGRHVHPFIVRGALSELSTRAKQCAYLIFEYQPGHETTDVHVSKDQIGLFSGQAVPMDVMEQWVEDKFGAGSGAHAGPNPCGEIHLAGHELQLIKPMTLGLDLDLKADATGPKLKIS